MKRFYKDVMVASAGAGFAIELDGRALKTPGKLTLQVPTKALAKALAGEWEAQEGEISPKTMHFNQLANTVLDRVQSQRDAIIDELVQYGGTDLLCYRAEHPENLVKMQEENWDPLLNWAAKELGAPLKVTSGIMHCSQSEDSLEALRGKVMTFDNFHLVVVHALTTGLGSLVLALAYVTGFVDFNVIWKASQIDDDFQVSQWGEDSEAKKARDVLYRDMEVAAKFLKLLDDNRKPA